MTNPLVPADVDLRGLPWMRLDTSRLLDSDLFALSTGDEFKAAVALWCKSWTQMPGGSLPNDDRILAHLSGAGSRWKKVKDMALRGWVQCSDGRLYHAVVAEQAIAAWQERQEYRAEVDAVNLRKQKERLERAAMFEQLKAAGHDLAWNVSTSKLRELSRSLSQEPVTPVTVTVTAKTGEGEGRESKALRATAVPSTPELPADPPPAAPPPTAAGRACRAMRDAGCPLTQLNPSHPDLLAALAEGVTAEALADTVREGIARSPPVTKPFTWAIATARGRLDESRNRPAPGTSSHAAHRPSPADSRPSATDRVLANIQRAQQQQQRGDDAIDGEAKRIAG